MHPQLRKTLLLLVAATLLWPKLSLAASIVFDLPFDSVIMCTGGKLGPVMVDHNGQIVDDITQYWEGDHCTSQSSMESAVHQGWLLTRRPACVAIELVPLTSTPLTAYSAADYKSARAPPVV